MKIDMPTKILIVDDLPENRHALTKVLEQEDRVAFQAESGEAALSLLLEHDFALAILDVMMPGMNGFELAELMRSTQKTRHIPIVFVTAAGKETNFDFQGYESGAVDFLHKPLDISAVKSKVNVFVELHQQRQELKQRIDELERTRTELQATEVELQRALQMRDDFMSMVAHELRTPLNTLHLETQVRSMLLEKNDMQAFSADQLKTMFKRDRRQIESMSRLITDLVDVSRIQNGRLSVHPVELRLSGLLHRVVEDLSQQANAAGCELRLDIQEDTVGLWDEFRLEQIVINLLTNAFRYGAEKPVDVSLEVQEQRACIRVRDHGPGIGAEDQHRIFGKFERVASRAVPDGLGMGLYIARQLAEAQGGTLSVKSEMGQGATFEVALPLT